jgi:outer membrane immunogenic protein
MIRNVVLGAVGGLAVASSAYAADIYAPSPPAPFVAPVPLWSGFYIGVNGGWGGNSGNEFRETLHPAVPGYVFAGSGTIDGGFGGGQLGYNFQTANFVYGLETDIEGSGIRGPALIAPSVTLPAANIGSMSVDYFGTIRARVGYSFGGVLLYGTGGFAYGGVNLGSRFELSPAIYSRFSNSETLTGWVAGAGIEYKFGSNWALKGEYQFIDLGSFSTSSPLTTTAYDVRGKTDVAFNTVRVGINYYFNTPYEPLK